MSISRLLQKLPEILMTNYEVLEGCRRSGPIVVEFEEDRGAVHVQQQVGSLRVIRHLK